MVELAGTGLRATALGFGSAALLGRLGERESLRLLERAYDEGIRYFDTAPLYGFGHAEALIGRFAKGKNDVVVATKVGLAFQGRSSPLTKYAADLARPVLRRVPNLRARAGSFARGRVTATSDFSVDSARESLESSLRKLGRPIDILLLHECRAPDLMDGDLFDFLSGAVSRGDIRAFGLGTDPGTISDALRDAPRFTRVLQFENNTRNRTLERLDFDRQSRAIITHTPFGGVGRVLDGDPRDALSYALANNRTGVVLFSTTREERIGANVRIANEMTAGD